MQKCLVLLFTMLVSSFSLAYPEFIGYGYSTCITCHMNGHGGGPLSDYGRALWSGEIASRALYPKKMSDEDIANQSGFFGSKELPYWIRPHIKYRGLNLRQNVGSSTQDTTKYYQMQAEAGLSLQADTAGKYAAVFTMGSIPAPEDYGTGTQGLKRMRAIDYYLRIEPVKTWWVYLGLLDKVYGLRNVDHTSYQRTFQGFNERNNSLDGIHNSQGIVVHKIEDTWEVAGNYFVGNPDDSAEFKQTGFSMMGEYEVGEKKRFGSSIYSAKSDMIKKNMFAVHYRQGLSKGSSFMFEYGVIEDDTTGAKKTTGSYNLLQGMILLTRGYNLKTTIERYNKEFKAEEPDRWKWSAGFLIFPAPRIEWRLEVVNMRDFSNQRAADDTWAAEGQIHVSL